MNKYEKELVSLNQKYQEAHVQYKQQMFELKNQAQAECNVYNGHIGVINSERHSLREELRALFDFLTELGDVGIPITIFDYVLEVPESISLESDNAGELAKREQKNHLLRDAATFMIFPAAFIVGQTVGGLAKRKKDKEHLLEQEEFVENEYTKWEKQKTDAQRMIAFYRSAAEIANLYRAIIATVRDTIKRTIIPELDGVCAFLAAFAIKDAITFADDPDEAVPAQIAEFEGTPYGQHYTFVKNTFEYYQLIKAFFTEPILTRIMSDREITKQEELDFRKKIESIQNQGKLLTGNVCFGGQNG